MSLYRTVVADPPWTPALGSTWATRFTDKARPAKHYETMTLEDIKALPIDAAPQSHLWLWCLSQHIDWGYEVARAWGFEPQIALTWAKPGLGVGRFQCNTEHVLLCRRGSRHGNPFGPTGGTVFDWPRGRHSEKPEAFYQLVERVSPGPYLEMFARRRRDGWHSWGKEVPIETSQTFWPPTAVHDGRLTEREALCAGTHEAAVDDFGNQYLERVGEPAPDTEVRLT